MLENQSSFDGEGGLNNQNCETNQVKYSKRMFNCF